MRWGFLRSRIETRDAHDQHDLAKELRLAPCLLQLDECVVGLALVGIKHDADGSFRLFIDTLGLG
jgi:hypothetical protein